MKKIGLGLFLACVLQMAIAEERDMDKALLCAVTHTVSCDALGECKQGPASAVNLPVFINFDLQNARITSATVAGKRRSSAILEQRVEQDTLVFFGTESGVAWNARIQRETGQLNASVVTGDMGYLIFGSCLEH